MSIDIGAWRVCGHCRLSYLRDGLSCGCAGETVTRERDEAVAEVDRLRAVVDYYSMRYDGGRLARETLRAALTPADRAEYDRGGEYHER